MKDRTVLALKGLAIIGVVFFHLTNRRLDAQTTEWMHIISGLFSWCVLAFFCVSGYLQALSDSKKHRPLLEFMRSRFMRLLVPFVLLVIFYASLWQLLQAFHFSNIAVRIPDDFMGKLEEGLWPVHSEVAEQLYFFPLLFGVSMVLVLVQKSLGVYGMWAISIVAAAIGLLYYPKFFTGFSWGVFDWGICFYAAGYLLFHYRAKKSATRIVLFVFTLVLIVCSGYSGIIRCVPLWLLSEGSTLKLDAVPLLCRIGEASGTIYIYHTPFLIRPMVIAATLLHNPVAQFIGILLSAAVAIFICCLIFETLKNTRAKFLLM